MTMMGLKTYVHDNRRRCILGPDGVWRHYDHPSPEPGPRQRVDYECRMDHWIAGIRSASLINDDDYAILVAGKGGPMDPTPDEDAEEYNPGNDDRGQFGMPTIGPAGMLPPLEFGPDKVFPIEGAHRYGRWIIRRTDLALDYGSHGETIEAVTEEARVALDLIGPLLAKFLRKNAQYARAQSGHDLGIKGIIPDINRKSSALVTRVWDAQDATLDTDSAKDLIEDLIGHLLLMLGKLEPGDG